MAETPGKVLWESLKKLGLDTGNLELNVIEGWYDTNSTELKEFLNFIANYITPQNTLSAEEIEEYEELKRQGLVLYGDDYDNAMVQMSNDHSGILEVDENEFEIEMLEDRKKIAIDDEILLDSLIKAKESINSNLDKQLSEVETKKVSSNIKKEKASEECLTLAVQLDELNTKLHEQVLKCSEKLEGYELATMPSHITNVPLHNYTHHYNNILKKFQGLEVQEIESLPKLQSAIKDTTKLNDTIFNHEDTEFLDNMKLRVFKSMQTKNYKEAELEKLNAEKVFLENFDVLSIINFTDNTTSLKSSIERNIYLKSEEYSKLVLDFEYKASRAAEKYTDLHSLEVAQQELKEIQEKLDYIQSIDKKFVSIFSYHCMLYLMFIANNQDISRSDEFFKAIHRYIIHELERCDNRIQAMEDVITEYEVYEKMPIETRSVLLRAIISILTNNNPDEITLKSAVTLVSDFRNDCEQIERKLFVDEPKSFRQEAMEVELNTRMLKKFMTSGPTSEYISMHYKLCKIFKEVDDIFKIENNAVHDRVAILNTATKKVSSNDWLKYKRLLWMYFLFEPKKILSIIDKIAMEVQERRRAHLE